MKAEKLIKALDSIEVTISSILFVVMSSIVFAQLLAREIFKSSIFTSEEIARFSYVWISFLCVSLAEKRREHFCVDVFLKFLKGKANFLVYVIEYLIGSVILAYLFYWSIEFSKFQSVRLSNALEIPMSVVAASMIVGFGMAFIRRTVNLIKYVIDNFNKYQAKEC